MLRSVLTAKVRQEKSNSLGAVQIEVATFYVTLHKPAPHHTMGSLRLILKHMLLMKMGIL